MQDKTLNLLFAVMKGWEYNPGVKFFLDHIFPSIRPTQKEIRGVFSRSNRYHKETFPFHPFNKDECTLIHREKK